jgi:hypothetical protein
MSYKIFIDDEREPPGNREDWVVCRTVAQAQHLVNRQGFPSFVSFDHDLGYNVPSGMDFAKWLVEMDIKHKLMEPDFDFYVHSQNPVGKANIEGLLRQYMQFRMA